MIANSLSFCLNRSRKIINLDIINFGSFDNKPDKADKACIQLYIINPNQQESVITDFDSEQILWKLIGHKLGPGNAIMIILF